MKRLVSIMLALLCVTFLGCAQKPPTTTAPPIKGPIQTGKPILTTRPSTVQLPMTVTSVVVTIFGDTAVLARNPVLSWAEEEEPLCQPRDISQGGRIGCLDEEGVPYPITLVIIMEDLVPASTRDWFRDLPLLTQIQGLEQVHTDLVEDMSHMFSGCTRLAAIDVGDWNVSGVRNMTGIFDGCTAMRDKPQWYR